MFQNEVKHVVLMPSSTNLDINKEVTHNTRQNNKIVGTQYREIPTTTTTTTTGHDRMSIVVFRGHAMHACT